MVIFVNKVLAVVPARKGSKRVVGKNIRAMNGKPCIEYVLSVLKEAKFVTDIIVSTDCEITKSISEQYVTIPTELRSKALSDDHTGADEVVRNVYKELGKEYDFVLTIYPTSVFISVSIVSEAFDLLIQTQGTDQLFTVSKYSHPIGRALRKKMDGTVEMLCPENYDKRTQDLEDFYFDAGQFYIQKPKRILDRSHLFLDNAICFDLTPYPSVDIDTEADFAHAEQLMRGLKLTY